MQEKEKEKKNKKKKKEAIKVPIKEIKFAVGKKSG